MPEHASFRETACESDSKSDHDRSIARKSECLPEHASFRETACESNSKSTRVSLLVAIHARILS